MKGAENIGCVFPKLTGESGRVSLTQPDVQGIPSTKTCSRKSEGDLAAEHEAKARSGSLWLPGDDIAQKATGTRPDTDRDAGKPACPQRSPGRGAPPHPASWFSAAAAAAHRQPCQGTGLLICLLSGRAPRRPLLAHRLPEVPPAAEDGRLQAAPVAVVRLRGDASAAWLASRHGRRRRT